VLSKSNDEAMSKSNNVVLRKSSWVALRDFASKLIAPKLVASKLVAVRRIWARETDGAAAFEALDFCDGTASSGQSDMDGADD
jgi:hypothetical protein